MTIRKMTRSFKYSGFVLPDPAPDLDVESVRSLYSASYPENYHCCAHGTGGGGPA